MLNITSFRCPGWLAYFELPQKRVEFLPGHHGRLCGATSRAKPASGRLADCIQVPASAQATGRTLCFRQSHFCADTERCSSHILQNHQNQYWEELGAHSSAQVWY